MHTITVAHGDGIGPEIMRATLDILEAAGAKLTYDEIVIGESVYLAGNASGIDRADWDVIRRNKVLLKAPITTPRGGGYKSLNVSARKFLGLFANVRPCRSFHPVIATKHPKMDVTIVRENEEDLYAGIEHQQTDEVVQCLKLISRPGCEKIVRYAFEYARAEGRERVTCFVKDNIMKQTDGLFRAVFEEIAAEYPDIKSDHYIVDIGTARLADTPERFDVIVTPNLYGDVISDVAAQITGSVGLAGSANIGAKCAMFEAIHGSAPDIAGQDVANPSGLLQAAVMMLRHLGEGPTAARVENAWLRTLEDGVHTADIYTEGTSRMKVGTRAFAQAVISNLGKRPEVLPVASAVDKPAIELPAYVPKPQADKRLLGVDVFAQASERDPQEIGAMLEELNTDTLRLTMITNRGIMVWPHSFEETFCTDHWRCRFEGVDGAPVGKTEIASLLHRAAELGIDTIKTENLYSFDGKRGFSLAQGHGVEGHKTQDAASAPDEATATETDNQTVPAMSTPATLDFPLIQGEFNKEDALDVLRSLVRAKINHHQCREFSDTERFGQDKFESSRRIGQLQTALEQIEAYFEQLPDDAQLNMDSVVNVATVSERNEMA